MVAIVLSNSSCGTQHIGPHKRQHSTRAAAYIILAVDVERRQIFICHPFSFGKLASDTTESRSAEQQLRRRRDVDLHILISCIGQFEDSVEDETCFCRPLSFVVGYNPCCSLGNQLSYAP